MRTAYFITCGLVGAVFILRTIIRQDDLRILATFNDHQRLGKS